MSIIASVCVVPNDDCDCLQCRLFRATAILREIDAVLRYYEAMIAWNRAPPPCHTNADESLRPCCLACVEVVISDLRRVYERE